MLLLRGSPFPLSLHYYSTVSALALLSKKEVKNRTVQQQHHKTTKQKKEPQKETQ
jgi:hypothetical protein